MKLLSRKESLKSKKSKPKRRKSGNTYGKVSISSSHGSSRVKSRKGRSGTVAGAIVGRDKVRGGTRDNPPLDDNDDE